MGYTKDVVRGVSWIGALSLVTKIIGFLEIIILARLLLPEQFGAYGVALLTLGLLEVVTETGVNIFLLQEKENIDNYISSAWIVSILRGIFIMLVLIIAAPFIAIFFQSEKSLVLLYLISLVSLLRGFINPSVIKFQKELLFAKDFWYRFTILIVNTFTAVSITYFTRNPVGIIIGLIAGVLTELALSFLIVSPRPSLGFNFSYISKIFHRGKWITASSFFDYLFHNVDNIVVGRLLGPASLGVYQLAYSLSVIPLTEISKVFTHVTYPVFTKISHDSSRLKTAFLKTSLTIIFFSIPIVIVLVVFSQFFVIILGQKWIAVSSILPILALLGFVKAVSGSSSALFFSQKKQGYATVITFVNILGILVLIIPLVLLKGIYGAGLAGFIGSLLAIPFMIYYVRKIFSNYHGGQIKEVII